MPILPSTHKSSMVYSLQPPMSPLFYFSLPTFSRFSSHWDGTRLLTIERKWVSLLWVSLLWKCNSVGASSPFIYLVFDVLCHILLNSTGLYEKQYIGPMLSANFSEYGFGVFFLAYFILLLWLTRCILHVGKKNWCTCMVSPFFLECAQLETTALQRSETGCLSSSGAPGSKS